MSDDALYNKTQEHIQQQIGGLFIQLSSLQVENYELRKKVEFLEGAAATKHKHPMDDTET